MLIHKDLLNIAVQYDAYVTVDNEHTTLHFKQGGIVKYYGKEIIDVQGDIGEFSPTRQIDLVINKEIRNVLIVGAGGIGSWVATALKMARPEILLMIFDGDVLEESNRERILSRKRDVGRDKVDVLKNLLDYIYEGNNLCVNKYFKIEYLDNCLIRIPDLIIDCTDNKIFQRELYLAAKQRNIRFYKVGSINNQFTISTIVPDPKFVSDLPVQTGRCGQGIPQWVATQMAAAANFVSLLLRNETISQSII